MSFAWQCGICRWSPFSSSTIPQIKELRLVGQTQRYSRQAMMSLDNLRYHKSNPYAEFLRSLLAILISSSLDALWLCICFFAMLLVLAVLPMRPH